MKKLLSIVMALLLTLGIALPVAAAPKKDKAEPMAAKSSTIYLKGEGKDFTEEWNNPFTLGGAESHADPSVWHLVYTGKQMDLISTMQIKFTNGEIFNWKQEDGFSTNQGDNNPGWVIIAPADWEIAYVNKGNNNQSESWLKTTESKLGQFNISGYHKGTPEEQPPKGSSATFTLKVTKELTEDASALLALQSGFYDFKFTPTVTIDGILQVLDSATITNSGTAEWIFNLTSELPDKTWAIEYSLIEGEVYGFELTSSTNTSDEITLTDGDSITANGTFVNGLVYASSSGDTAAAFSVAGSNYNNGAWHFTSFDRDDIFEVRAGQKFVVAKGYLDGDTPVFTEVHPGVQLRNIQIGFSNDAHTLAGLPPGHLIGGSGQYVRIHWATHYAVLLDR